MRYPVFLTVRADDPIRAGHAFSVASYWLRNRQVETLVIIAVEADRRFFEILDLWDLLQFDGSIAIRNIPIEGSQKRRHVIALEESRAVGAEWFVQCDEDILPLPEFDLDVAVDLARQARAPSARFGIDRGAEFGMVALALPDCHLTHLVDPEAKQYAQRPVEVVGAAGGCRIMSTAIDPAKLPFYDQRMRGYDCPLAEGIREQGMAVGYYTDAAPRDCRAVNLSGPLSSVWPQLAVPEEFPRPGPVAG